ncbi:MAG TPA: LamG domain-containing protein [Anaerohalosphaeraceae bacterium]|nr:LamG domain-containing protein [Anaerohalosphaeraceae bacterium]HOL89035.1 LamG domain-containing protein [Anaerohalosphaeraceae bacterium]HPP56931.1 LamG domain-containing protein [Anaerohalosphaeraceae bacterium]
MSNRMKTVTAFCAALLMLAAAPTYAVVIGDWEGTPDGWIDWGNKESVDSANNMPSKYQYASIGATRGSQSLKVIQSGWGQSLSIQLNAEQRAAFMAGEKFSIDMTVAANDGSITGGYTQIHTVYMNAPGPGFTAVVTDAPLNFYWWSGSPQRTQTLVVDYKAFRDQITSPDYIEIVLALNTGGGAPPEMYFDNAQIILPQTYEELVRQDNPVLYLKFDKIPLADSSPNNYWVQQRTGASLAANIGMGNAIYLNGTSSGCVAASKINNPSWGGTYGDQYSFAPNDITFEFWAKIEMMEQYGMFFQQIGPYTREDFAPGFGQAGPAANTLGNLRILNGTTDANDLDFWYPGTATPSDGGWHHYVVTYDEGYGGNPDQMQIQLFLDGQLVGSTVVGQTGLPARLGPEQDHLVIGGENNRGYIYNVFKGWMDEFAIYAGVLSSERVAAHYAQGRLEIEPQNCEQVFQRGQGLAGDFNRDCMIDLNDFVYIAQSWLVCNDPQLFGSDPLCEPTW